MNGLESSRILVTPTSYARHDPALKTALEEQVGEVIYNDKGRPLTSDELQAILPDCHGFIAGLDVIDANALSGANHLKVIARYGSGVDRVDLDFAKERGIVVTNTPGANAVSVAELAVSFILALARNIVEANRETHAGAWPRLSGLSLENKTVGLIGFGAIGKAVARRLNGFECEIMTYDPMVDEGIAHDYGVRMESRETVIQHSDFLSLHVPVLPQTRGMVDTDFLTSMKAGRYLINTARGELIDESSLIQALESGHLRGAALDCFVTEPPGEDHPLLNFPQVITTPHTGAHTDGATNAMGWGALQDCIAVLQGYEPKHRVV